MLADHLPAARYLLADKAYDADHWRAWLKRRRIRAVIPNKINRKQPHPFARRRYRHRNVIECMFGRLKDFRRVATRESDPISLDTELAYQPVEKGAIDRVSLDGET